MSNNDISSTHAQSVIVALGSNIGEREEFLRKAVEEIQRLVGELKQASSSYQTAPLLLPGYDGPAVNDYLNMVVEVSTELCPERLLATLLEIEKDLGRNRALETSRWMSRVIDLDIIFYGDQIIESETLRIPHPEMHKRDFVLKPLLEIAPDWKHPRLGKLVSELYDELSNI